MLPGRHVGDWVFFNLTRFFALLTLLMLVGIMISLTYGLKLAHSSLRFRFLVSGDWNPPMEKFGALIPIYGTWRLRWPWLLRCR